VQSFGDDCGDPLEQFTAQARIVFAFPAQAFSVQRIRQR
jgi:hypothetical protein